jgi:hypothetical protein
MCFNQGSINETANILEAYEHEVYEFGVRYDTLSDIWTKLETDQDLYFYVEA